MDEAHTREMFMTLDEYRTNFKEALEALSGAETALLLAHAKACKDPENGCAECQCDLAAAWRTIRIFLAYHHKALEA